MRKYSIFIQIMLLIVMGQTFSAITAQDSNTVLGHIAYIGSDYNVYTIQPSAFEINTLTTDADTTRHYLWPTWSNDGRLAYFCCDPVASGRTELEVFITQSFSASGERLYFGDDQVFTYAYWSPGDCRGVANCRDLAVLVSNLNPQGLSLQIVRHDDSQNTSWTAERGAPFYFTWSRSGDQIIWLRNESVYEIYDASEQAVQERLQTQPGRSLIPIWSSVDDRIFLSVRGEDTRTNVVTLQTGQTESLITQLEGAISFLVSPDGRLLAYRTITGNGVGQLTVIEVATGTTIAESPSGGVAAFFWSPNSQTLAYVTLETQPGTFSAKQGRLYEHDQPIQLVWQVLDVESGQNRTLERFTPTNDMVYLLSFFEQFAHSHRIWSPDSTHIVYGEATRSGIGIVRILDVTIDNSQPITVADGQIGIWSFD